MVHGMIVYIYGLYDPRTDACRYVGKTINLRQRFYGHVKYLAQDYKSHWINELKHEGLKPTMRVLEEIHNSDDTDWQHRERYWIGRMLIEGCRLTNLDSGGIAGCRKSEASREKNRIAALGKKRTPESLAKLSSSLRGRPVSQETRDKIRNSQLGKFVSEETRSKIRAARAKQIITPETRAKLSAISKGRKPSPQTIAASILAHKNRIVSEETRAKMRAAKLGRPLSSEHRAKLGIAQTLRWAKSREQPKAA